MTQKKVTKVEGSQDQKTEKKVFKPSAENKKKATNQRIIAFLLWAVAIGLEIFGILQLKKPEINLILLVVILVVMAILSIGGSFLWKGANRLDPASEANKVKFFIQNQLGLIMSIIAFLPLIVLVLLNKDLDKKEKGIVTTVAVIALALTGFLSTDHNPVSVEKYTEEIAFAEQLLGEDYTVYWTEHGKVYHLFEDCHHINRSATVEIFEGAIPTAYEHRNIEELCKTCESRARKQIESEKQEEQEEAALEEASISA